MYRVIIAGSRTFNNYDFLEERMLFFLKNKDFSEVEIVHGNAKGADLLGGRFANKHGIKCVIFKADWDRHGRSAGIVRNVDMSEYGNALVAFWNGESSGTAHMIEVAKKNGLDVRVVYF